jgi:hypothetical protein
VIQPKTVVNKSTSDVALNPVAKSVVEEKNK